MYFVIFYPSCLHSVAEFLKMHAAVHADIDGKMKRLHAASWKCSISNAKIAASEGSRADV